MTRCSAFAELGIDHATVITTGPWIGESVATLADAADQVADLAAQGK